MSLKNARKIIEVVKPESFNYFIDSNAFVYIYDQICTLTPFFYISLKKMGSESKVDLELGMTVLSSSGSDESSLVKAIDEGMHLILPYIIPYEKTRFTIIQNGILTPWLTNYLKNDLNKYCLGRDAAYELITNQDDKFIDKLIRVYGDRFNEKILMRLAN